MPEEQTAPPTPTREDANHGTTEKTLEPHHSRFYGCAQHERKETMDQVLVVVDIFSKQTILIPARKNMNIKEIFHLMWERIFSVFGIPERIISDRDKIFKPEEWQRLTKGIGIMHILSTANHQQTDGQSERKIEIIWTTIKKTGLNFCQ